MKKLYQSSKYKAYNRKHARSSICARCQYVNWLKNKRFHEIGLTKSELAHKRKQKTKYWDFVHICAPRRLCVLTNSDAVFKFLEKIQECHNGNKKVFLVLKDVEEIDNSAILLLLSGVIRFKSIGIDFDGDFPRNANVKHVLVKSGFFRCIINKVVPNDKYEVLSNNDFILTHASKRVDADIGDAVIGKMSKAIWGSSKRCQGVQRTLIELMHNTHDHADVINLGTKHWWLSVNLSDDHSRVSFSFTDFGVGVFTSLDNKSIGQKFHEWRSILSRKFTFKSNPEILKLILDGKLHETVTGKPFRGKGLPGIAMTLKRNQISNLHIITNDVFCDYENSNYKKLETPFSGTLVYWEISKNNECCNDN